MGLSPVIAIHMTYMVLSESHDSYTAHSSTFLEQKVHPFRLDCGDFRWVEVAAAQSVW